MPTDDFSELLDELTSPRARPWHPAPQRRDLAARLPRTLAAAIAQRHARLDEARRAMPGVVWSSLVDAQGGATGDGWAEVVAAVAVAVDLLTGGLPQELRARVARSPQIEAEFRRRLLPFERYALLVDGQGRVARAHVDVRKDSGEHPVRPGRIEDRPGLEWALDAPSFVGRSHTLLLALLAFDAQDRVLPDDMAIAATGELAEDGVTVRTVNGFAEKLAAWWAAHPRGLLISAPPPAVRDGAAANPTPLREEGQRADRDWIVGATLDEVAEKARRFTRERREPKRLTIWNGSVRSLAQLAPWRLRSRDGVSSPSAARDRSFGWGGRAEECLARALSGEDAPQGVVIRGAPGTGKSLLLQVLQGAFISSALGRLGFAVGVRAADLARELTHGPEALLAVRAGLSAQTLHALELAGRLVVLIDGLDEIDDASLARIGGWLQRSRIRYIATARPTRTLGAMPRCLECEIVPLELDRARALLDAEGRADLAALVPERPSYHSGTPFPAGLTTLLDTPLSVSLFAAAAPAATGLRDLHPAGVYERVFKSLLAHASHSGRLDPEAVRTMERGGRLVGARLALRWLREEREVSREAVRVEVERAGYSGEGADRLVEALEFGHLLVPGANGFSFAHRTLAEWLAARGLDELVERAVAAASPGRAEDIEDGALDALLPRTALAGSAWWQTALFYAPFARAPARLLRRVLDGSLGGRAGSARWGSQERFAQALDLASACQWRSAKTACEVWALFARALTVPLDDGPHADPLLRERPRPDITLERFLSAVAPHLPATLGALCDLAGLDERWRCWFLEQPERLLRAVPRVRLAVFDARLRGPDVEARCKLLRRHAELGERAAGETHAALRAEPPPPEPPAAYSPQARWEEALFDYWIAVGEGVPSLWLRARAGDWPPHLQGPLSRWLDARLDERGEGIGDRVEALERFVGSVVAERERLLAELRGIVGREDHVRVLQAMHERLDASPPDSAQRTLRELVEAIGVEIPRSRSFRAEVSEEDRSLLEEVRRWDRRDGAMKQTLRGLGAVRREELLGGVFAHLRAGSPERRYVILHCLALDRVPPEATVDELLDATERPGHGLARELLPGARRVPADSHTQRWRELAATARGRRRLLALEWCAFFDGSDLTTALVDATPRDDEFASLRREHMLQYAATLSAEQVARLEPAILEALPLRARAAAKVTGWREGVLEALGAEAVDVRREACDIVRKERLFDAKPRLLERFSAAPEGAVCAALEALVEPTERDLIRRLLASEPSGWEPGDRLLALMEVDDLPTFLSRAPTPWRTQGTFETHLIRLGRPAHRAVREALAAQPDARDTQARRTSELRHLLVLTSDPATTAIAEFVGLAREVLCGDRHTIWSQPGSLGSDFDDFADQDFHSELEDRGLIDLLFQRIDARLALAPGEQDRLRDLFRHPSETVQVAAYQRIAKRVGPVVAAQLGRELLEAHALHTRTEVGGDTAGLALAGLGHGAGENHVDTREASRRLLEAVRAQLSPLAAAEVRSWLASAVAAVRRLGVTWLGEVGVPGDDALFERALRDRDGQVVLAALIALTRTDPGRDWPTLLAAAASGWGAAQLGAAVSWWFRRDGEYDPVDPIGSTLVPWRRSDKPKPGSEPVQVLVGRLLVEVGTRVENELIGDERKQAVARAVDQLLRRIEELEGRPLSTASWPAGAIAGWVTHASPWMRRVGVAAMARRGMLEADAQLSAMFEADDPADRRVGLVELSALGARDLLGRLVERWRGVTAPYGSASRKEIPDDERPGAWEMFEVLVRGPVEFAWLLPHISRIVDVDEEAGMISSEGEETLRRLAPSIRRWGLPGFEALLEATREPGRGRWCAEYLLVHLRDELPTKIRARLGAAEEGEPLPEGADVSDEFADVRRQIIQPTPDEEDAVIEACLKERIGPGEILRGEGSVPA